MKMKIKIARIRIPSLCPACDSRESVVALAFGPEEVADCNKAAEMREDKLKKTSRARVKKTPK